MSKARYKSITGREQKRDADVLCYQIRQSFPPGELDPEEALNIGYELAMRWTKGKHAFFVVSHADRPTLMFTFTTIPPPLTAPGNTGIF